jgi:transposase
MESCEGVRPLKRSGANLKHPTWVGRFNANPIIVRVREANVPPTPELFSFFWCSLEHNFVSHDAEWLFFSVGRYISLSYEEWGFSRPYPTLMREDAPQREHSLREAFNGLRQMTKGGATWRMAPHALPPWRAIYDQIRRWFNAGIFDAIVQDFREFLACLRERRKTRAL